MANKKAFVRYADNKAVPGSLIVRTKAPSVGVWKEVTYDLCCGDVCSGCEKITITAPLNAVTIPPPYEFIRFEYECKSSGTGQTTILSGNFATVGEAVEAFNTYQNGNITILVNGGQVSVTLCKPFAPYCTYPGETCPPGSLEAYVSIFNDTNTNLLTTLCIPQ
jgi:hypothetical protein